jgi:hypothetical protein
VFMRLLCNWLCRCSPDRGRKADNDAVVADAPAPTNGSEEQMRQADTPKRSPGRKSV